MHVLAHSAHRYSAFGTTLLEDSLTRNASEKRITSSWFHATEGVRQLCGIAGFTHKNWKPGPKRIRSAEATLVHRGPDQQGVYQSDFCALAATRLKIIDLDSGDQPIVSQD